MMDSWSKFKSRVCGVEEIPRKLGMTWFFGVAFSMATLPPSSFANIEPTDAEATLVVFNKNEPQSEELALYYAKARSIPSAHLCPISCPVREEITRQEYYEEIETPIRSFVHEHELLVSAPVAREGKTLNITSSCSLRYIVLCYGVPLKIAHDPNVPIETEFQTLDSKFQTNAAAVDSELANLPSDSSPLTAYVSNPLFKKRFSESALWNQRLLCVARLDGPTLEKAKALVDGAIYAETYGLFGRAFFDSRGLPESDLGYKWGDDQIEISKKLFLSKHWEVVSDDRKEVFSDEADASSCAIYAGWYAQNVAGPFRAKDFQFRPGAIAYHIHSLSAATLRSTTTFWVGPFVEHGAGATLGCVYEPYLQMTPAPSVLFEALLEGASFGEAAYSSQPYLSWMNTVVGDPLYRPFGISTAERIERLEKNYSLLDENGKKALAWAYRMKSRELFMEGNKTEALQLAFDQATRLQQRAIWTGLANLYLLSADFPRAAEAAKAAVHVAKKRSERATSLRFAAQTCLQASDIEAALDFYRTLLREYPDLPDFQRLANDAAAAAHSSNKNDEATYFETLLK